MKILFDFQDTIGGAPRSHLEHAKAIAKKGAEIIAVIDGEENRYFFKGTNFEVYHIPTFGRKGLLQRFKILLQYKQLVEKVKPDLLYANRTSHVYLLSILSDITGIPILCARAGGRGIPLLHKMNRDRNYVVYSEENYNEFIEMGFRKSNLFLIKNRISELNIYHENNFYTESMPKQLLVIGNIKNETIHGIQWFLKKLIKIQESIKHKFVLKIAGEYVKLSEKSIGEFESIIDQCNYSLKGGNEVVHLGWVENLENQVEQSHICLGKGRSVIQPLMAGKNCFVLSEKNGIFHCNETSFSKLSKNNFTGRNLNINGDFRKLIENINSNDYTKADVRIIQLAREEYSAKYLGEKLMEVIKITINNKRKSSRYAALKRYFNLLKFGAIYRLNLFK